MICIGISYKTAAVSIREYYSFSSNESELLGRHWTRQGWVQGMLLVSTCNRTEFYLSGVTIEVAQLLREINRWKVEEMKGRIHGELQDKLDAILKDEGEVRSKSELEEKLESEGEGKSESGFEEKSKSGFEEKIKSRLQEKSKSEFKGKSESKFEEKLKSEVEVEMDSSWWYFYQEREAIRHLIEVAAGMDSMVLGEDEILHQIKLAYEKTLFWGQSCYELNRIVQSAFRWVKKIKSETILSKTPVSVATLVTKLLNEQLNNDRITSILILGSTGEIGSLVRKTLSNSDKYRLVLTRRDKSNAHREQNEATDFMNSDTRWVEYEQRYQCLRDADVVICATMSPTYVFLKKYIEDITKPMIWIDLGVPANIDPEIGALPRMKRYDIDHFTYIAEENNQKKASALIQGKRLSLQGAEQILDSLMIPQ